MGVKRTDDHSFSIMTSTPLLVPFLISLCVLASALSLPVAPKWGSYTWQPANAPDNDLARGKTVYDHVLGYVREDSWNMRTYWDLRAQVATVSVLGEDEAVCVTVPIDATAVPTPLSFAAYAFSHVMNFNGVLAEEWSDGFGGVVYVDVSSRDIVGLGNRSLADDSELVWRILSWSDTRPASSALRLSATQRCEPLNITAPARRATASACDACQQQMAYLLPKLCDSATVRSCFTYPAAVPYCARLKAAACAIPGGKPQLSVLQACRLIQQC